MSVSDFDAFKAEIAAIKNAVSTQGLKTVRDEQLRDRIRALFRTWTAVIQPTIVPLLQEKREFLKLGAELEALAKITSKIKSVSDYRKRLNKVIGFANNIILYLPPSKITAPLPRVITGEMLFIKEIPDLPTRFIPNSLLGWKSRIEAFVNEHPFENSVFIMIRYRKRNNKLISSIKDILKKNNFYGVLASEHNLTDDLYNPVACLLCCSRGIIIFDREEKKQTFNPNVAYELGMMHLLRRECLILKHDTLEILHTDILMKLYKEYNSVASVTKHITDWLTL
jgi:hypothetical protein